MNQPILGLCTLEVPVSEVRIKAVPMRLAPPEGVRDLVDLGDTLRQLKTVLISLVSGYPQPPALVIKARELRRPHAEIQQEINGSKGLLLEIIRRAAYDWVLYRSSSRILNRKLAEESFNWLFSEKPGTPEWNERMRSGKHLTGFIGICEALDLDPDTMRSHIRRLTAKNVRNVGRPAEYRRTDQRVLDDHDVNGLPPGMHDNESASDSLVVFEDLMVDNHLK